MLLHHLGYVFDKNKKNELDSKIKNKISDYIQNNYIYFEFSKKFNLWLEYIVPMNEKSTVFKFSKKSSEIIHHYGFYTKSINKDKKKLINNNYILLNKFKIKVPVFGGKIQTLFFYKNENLIELLSKV
jgi:hypothetical protein